MGVMQDFDQAVLQLKPLVQQLPQAFQLVDQRDRVMAIAIVTTVVERQRHFGDDLNARVNLLGQIEATLVTKGLGFAGQLFVHLEMASGHIVNQDFAEVLQHSGR